MQDPDPKAMPFLSPELGGGDKVNPGDTPQEVPMQEPDEVPPDQTGAD